MKIFFYVLSGLSLAVCGLMLSVAFDIETDAETIIQQLYSGIVLLLSALMFIASILCLGFASLQKSKQEGH